MDITKASVIHKEEAPDPRMTGSRVNHKKLLSMIGALEVDEVLSIPHASSYHQTITRKLIEDNFKSMSFKAYRRKDKATGIYNLYIIREE